MSRYESPVSVAEAIEDVREAHATLRQIAKRDGRTRRTINAQLEWSRMAERGVAYLMDHGHRIAVGLLTEEDELASRISECDVPRPELRDRLTTTRRSLRAIVRTAGTDTTARA